MVKNDMMFAWYTRSRHGAKLCKRVLASVAVALVCLSLSGGIANVSVETISGDGDVSTRGKLVFAQCFNTDKTYASGETIAVNGVPFRYSGSTTNDWTDERISFSVQSATVSPAKVPDAADLSASYRAILSGRYGGNWGAKATRFWTINGLEKGRSYLIQFWLQESDYVGKSLAMWIGKTDEAYTLGDNLRYADASGLGQVVSVEFTTESTTAALYMNDSQVQESRSYFYINAIQVRALMDERLFQIDGKEVQIEPIDGDVNLVKRGPGELILFGNNSYNGDCIIEAGTVRLGSINDIPGVIFDFDASSAGTVQTNAEGVVIRWTDSNARKSLDDDSGILSLVPVDGTPRPTTYCFGGRSAVRMATEAVASCFQLNCPNQAMVQPDALLFVCHHDVATDSARLWARHNGESGSVGSLIAAPRSIQFSTEGSEGRRHIFVDGKQGQTQDEMFLRDMLVCVTNVAARVPLADQPTQRQFIGGRMNAPIYTYVGSIGEAIALDHAPSAVELSAIQAYLMNKWSVTTIDGVSAAYEPLPRTASLRLSAQATLDLGGLAVTVASFVGSGTVTNGTLKTADGMIVQRGGPLTVPAADGMAYVAESVEERLIITGDAENVTIRIPSGYVKLGAVSQKRAIYCRGTPSFEYEDGSTRVLGQWGDSGWWGYPSGCKIVIR